MPQYELTIGYGRKIQPVQYESEEASCYLKEIVEADEAPDFGEQAAKLMFEAKVQVLTQLGRSFRVDEHGVVVEEKTAVAQAAASFGSDTVVQPPVPGPGPAYAPQAPAPQPVPGPAPAGSCHKCGGAMYDNRNDNARRRAAGFKLGADFKCKDKQCNAVKWPADFDQYKSCPVEPR